MNENINTGEIFGKLEAIQIDLAGLRSDMTHYKTSHEKHDKLLIDLASWRDQMVGRVAIISVLFGLVAAIVGSLVVSAFGAK